MPDNFLTPRKSSSGGRIFVAKEVNGGGSGGLGPISVSYRLTSGEVIDLDVNAEIKGSPTPPPSYSPYYGVEIGGISPGGTVILRFAMPGYFSSDHSNTIEWSYTPDDPNSWILEKPSDRMDQLELEISENNPKIYLRGTDIFLNMNGVSFPFEVDVVAGTTFTDITLSGRLSAIWDYSLDYVDLYDHIYSIPRAINRVSIGPELPFTIDFQVYCKGLPVLDMVQEKNSEIKYNLEEIAIAPRPHLDQNQLLHFDETPDNPDLPYLFCIQPSDKAPFESHSSLWDCNPDSSGPYIGPFEPYKTYYCNVPTYDCYE